MREYRYYLITAAVVVAAFVVYPLVFRGSSVVAESQLQEMVFVDPGSGKAFLIRAKTTPETNPETGKQTLVPGLYCEKCAAWKPVGSMERLQSGQAMRKCPVHKIALSAEGPRPERAGK